MYDHLKFTGGYQQSKFSVSYGLHVMGVYIKCIKALKCKNSLELGKKLGRSVELQGVRRKCYYADCVFICQCLHSKVILWFSELTCAAPASPVVTTPFKTAYSCYDQVQFECSQGSLVNPQQMQNVSKHALMDSVSLGWGWPWCILS